jgi:hypothetical protein
MSLFAMINAELVRIEATALFAMIFAAIISFASQTCIVRFMVLDILEILCELIDMMEVSFSLQRI